MYLGTTMFSLRSDNGSYPDRVFIKQMHGCQSIPPYNVTIMAGSNCVFLILSILTKFLSYVFTMCKKHQHTNTFNKHPCVPSCAVN